ncbi:MAG: RluA family pseudouridine synthase [Eubacterium sp.]|nr:RluA family pseudouridine synthase [Eubacterium sp.]
MQEIIIGKNEAGQRFDKYLFKYFKEAPSGFIYKMLRKKNIVLNGKKSDGRDKLNEKDIIKVFMADETIEKFRGIKDTEIVTPVDLDIVYEDENVVFINKPSGMLSQKASDCDISVNEYLISYLVNKGELTRNDLLTFKPGICNRLDRNTSGLIVAGKSLAGLQKMALMFKERMMDKYYLALVEGTVKESMTIKGYLTKDEKANKVYICKSDMNGQYIETKYEPLKYQDNLTLLKVKLITGKPHQIRAHLASIGHPIVGDYKYGNKNMNDKYKKQYGIESQMLHSWQLVFHAVEGECANLSDKTFQAQPPKEFDFIL